jgi:hypothetical protein
MKWKTQHLVLGIVVTLSATVKGHCENYGLPVPPKQFFVELAQSQWRPGDPCIMGCGKLRAILGKSVLVSPFLVAKLFQEGKILLADTRTRSSFRSYHILGAFSFPYDEIHKMRLKPSPVPIALY